MKTILITGATDGIGIETAIALSRQGHEVILHGRSLGKAERTRAEILQAVPNAHIQITNADLADLVSVADMAKDLVTRFPKLDVLINNAGVYMKSLSYSKDGYEMTIAVNHIAHFLLTNLLLPLLKGSSDPRVISVSSIAHSRGVIDFGNLNAERHFDAYTAYATSKLANLIFSYELARREPWICSNSLHPGVIDTKLLRTGFGAMGGSVPSGALTSIFLATSNEVHGVTGKYFDRCAEAKTAQIATDEKIAKDFWKWTEKAVS